LIILPGVPPQPDTPAFPLPERLPGRIFQAIPQYERHLEQELGTWDASWGPFYYAANPPSQVFWFQNCWTKPFRLEFNSISQAASALRSIQRNWAPSLFAQFRRGTLVASKLPPLSSKKRPFPWTAPDSPMGAWSLLDATTLIGSAECASPFPGGAIEFEEDREGPPSRAYLKLWEALAYCGRLVRPGERCLDAGASPGGWTWALANLGAEVLSVDRAPLEDRVLAMPSVSFQKHDAFTLSPADIGPLDWVFCDVICYPRRLYEWIAAWLDSGLCDKFVCTIKMQGQWDAETTRLFAAIPGGLVVHLYHNKHELTWIKIR
jgi:23S rRNA (cytidine2498-2'-O)-methyltransferase